MVDTTNISDKASLPPGTLIHIGEQKLDSAKVTVIDYNAETFRSMEAEAGEILSQIPDNMIRWIDLHGLHDTELIAEFGRDFAIHPLVLEDIINTSHRPKHEDFGDYIFIIMKRMIENGDDIQAEQISIIMGSNYVITFQEGSSDIFGPIRTRLQRSKGRIRRKGADYLTYALLDTVVDDYFRFSEILTAKSSDIETELLERPDRQTLNRIYYLRNEGLFVYRMIWPLREVIGIMERSDSDLIDESTAIYFKDVNDHIIHLHDNMESLRSISSSMLDTYLSSVSNRMNDVMRILTIFASIFIPLTFIAGIYGMNFEYMPELQWRWGYPTLLGVMATILAVMLIYFRRKEWL